MSDGNNGIDVEVYDTGGAGSVIVGDWTSGSVVADVGRQETSECQSHILLQTLVGSKGS